VAQVVKFDLAGLDAMAQAQKRFPDILSARMTAAARRVVVPAFRQEMRNQPAPGMVKRLIIPGSYALAGFGGFTTVAAVSTERLSGGATASQLARAWEFGTSRRGVKKRVTRRNLRLGSTYYRDTTAQVPDRRRKGWIYYPAMAALDKRAIPLYVQVAVLTLADALEGKS
jgi:hypothetical protein